MYSMKKIDGKECNTAKGMSIATEFEKLKDVVFNERIIRHKMKRIQSKKHRLGTYDDKRYVLDGGIHALAYFHKDSVISCEKIKKDYDKKDCKEIKKILIKKIVIKKIVIIEKDWDN